MKTVQPTAPDPTLAGAHRGLSHRAEIDGLRAWAVLPVILFHAGFSFFGGGYVGVDVFFVISGFLITSIIANELRGGRFSIVRFYERRARRILPALFFVMLVCLPMAWWLMLPQEAVGFGRSLVAVSAFASNMFFWRTSGYFDLAAEEKPLLHTWSLGVEEQFYVVFPVLLALCWRWGTRRLVTLLLLLAAASLLASEWALESHALASFFLAPLRAWELLAGALLALGANQRLEIRQLAQWPRWAREALAALGLLLIAVPVFAYDATTPFPGVSALPPVLGTLLALAFAQPDTAAGQLLRLRPVLWLGLISYSAYLWHQPLLAFARLASPGAPAVWLMGALAALSLALGHLSWRYIEAPFRAGSRWSRRSVFAGAGAATVAFVAVGAVLNATQGLPQRWSAQHRPLIEPAKTRFEGCPAIDAWLHVCPVGKPGHLPSVALLGDSHAYALATALDMRLAAAGRAGVVVHTACHPIAGIFDSREPTTEARVAYCTEAHRRLQDFVAQPGIAQVVLAMRWTGRLYPMGETIDAPAFDNHEGGAEQDFPFRRNLALDDKGRMTDAAMPKALALSTYLRQLAERKPTVVVGPVPEVGWMPPRLNLLALARTGAPPPQISTSWDRFKERNAAAMTLLLAAQTPRLQLSLPEALLCNTHIPERCAVQVRDQLYYSDDDHLSNLGALQVIDDVLSRGGQLP